MSVKAARKQGLRSNPADVELPVRPLGCCRSRRVRARCGRRRVGSALTFRRPGGSRGGRACFGRRSLRSHRALPRFGPPNHVPGQKDDQANNADADPKPAHIRQISEPGRTRSLPIQHPDLSYEQLAMKPARDFGRGGGFEEQGQRLDEVGARFLNRCSLTGNVEFGAQRNKTVPSSRSVIAVRRCASSWIRVYISCGAGPAG